MDPHQHQANEELLDTQRGIWVVKVTFVALLITALVQGVVTLVSGSAALFADTVHGLSNALTTLPYVMKIAQTGVADAVRQDQSLARGLNIYGGKVTNEAVARALGLPWLSPEQALGI